MTWIEQLLRSHITYSTWQLAAKLLPLYEKKRKTRLGEERGNEIGKVVIAHGSVEFCEATPIGLVDESKESLFTDARRTEICVTPTCVAPLDIQYQPASKKRVSKKIRLKLLKN